MNLSNISSPGELTLARAGRPQANAVAVVVSRHEPAALAGAGAGTGTTDLQSSIYLLRGQWLQSGIFLPAWPGRPEPRRRPRRRQPVNRHLLSALAVGLFIVCLAGASGAAALSVRYHEARRAREVAALEARRAAEVQSAAEQHARAQRDAGIERALEQHRQERAGAQVALRLIQQNLHQLEQKVQTIESQRADMALQDLFQQAHARASEGKLDQAVEACEQMLRLSVDSNRDQRIVRDTLEHVAESCFALGRYEQGIVLLERALGAAGDDNNGADAPQPIDPSDWSDWRLLARIYAQQRRYADAERIYGRLVASRERVVGRDDPLLAEDAAELGELYERQGRAGEAEALYKLSMQIREDALGPFHPDVARSALRLGDLYRIRGNSAEADALYDLARDIRQRSEQN